MFINDVEVKTDKDLFAYDGCHKIYIIEDDNDLRDAQETGYDILHIQELENTYNTSCPLRFISNWKLSKRYVKQCEDNIVFSYTRKELVS